jgi:hypothetical protein
MHEMITGHVVFLEKSLQEYLHAHLYQNPPGFRQMGFSVPIHFEEIIQKCLAKDPNLRFQNFNELGAALLAVFGNVVGKDWMAPQVSSAENQKKIDSFANVQNKLQFTDNRFWDFPHEGYIERYYSNWQDE